jgi:hypothetical protein
MATTTPNFGWPVPTSTDLVKDGATAIEALGDSIDASLLDLKGGTTGQVLSKNSNTDMDFTWVTDAAGDITGVTAGTGISGGGTSGTVTVTNSMATAIDAKGDLVAGTAADTFARLAVGTNGQVLTADSAEATGLKWATPGGGFTLISTQTMSATAALNVNNCFSSTYRNYRIIINTTNASVNDYVNLKLRVSGTDSSTSYHGWYARNFSNNATQPTQTSNINNGTRMEITSGGQNLNAALDVLNPFTVGRTGLISVSQMWDTTNSRNIAVTSQIQHSEATSYDGFSLIPDSGTMTGTVYIYGYGL